MGPMLLGQDLVERRHLRMLREGSDQAAVARLFLLQLTE
jgi:hypothetical protein